MNFQNSFQPTFMVIVLVEGGLVGSPEGMRIEEFIIVYSCILNVSKADFSENQPTLLKVCTQKLNAI